jgi:hypothetical protein
LDVEDTLKLMPHLLKGIKVSVTSVCWVDQIPIREYNNIGVRENWYICQSELKEADKVVKISPIWFIWYDWFVSQVVSDGRFPTYLEDSGVPFVWQIFNPVQRAERSIPRRTTDSYSRSSAYSAME